MSNSNLLLSIIIPTKNRYSTLLPVVKGILEYNKSLDFELIIQDNSDDNTIFIEYLKENIDQRLKYFYIKDSIPLVQNIDLGISNINGEYSIFIGDDDFTHPQICQVVAEMKRQDISSLIYNAGFYWWESVEFTKESDIYGSKKLWLPLKNTENYVKLDPSNELKKVLVAGAMHYGNLPRFYHGIVKTNFLHDIKSRIGKYVDGTSPDMSFSVSLALVLNEYYFLDFPLSVFGASRNSGAGWGVKKSHYGKIEQMSFLPKDTLKKWDVNLPKIWSGNTTMVQTTQIMLSLFESKLKINYVLVYAKLIATESFMISDLFEIKKFKKYIISPKVFLILSNSIAILIKNALVNRYLLFKYLIGKFNYIVYSNLGIKDAFKEYSKIKLNK
jgi:glycosyltransferase involved in cell wall biosynthesis